MLYLYLLIVIHINIRVIELFKWKKLMKPIVLDISFILVIQKCIQIDSKR